MIKQNNGLPGIQT